MIPLNQIEIAKPCRASWADMAGDETVRFCTECSRNVYNLSAMTADRAQALVNEKEGKVCVRFYRRKDGTMMTSDCPLGVRIARRRFVTARSWAVTLFIASVTGTALLAASHPTATMGAPMALPVSEHKPAASTEHTKAVKKNLHGAPKSKSMVKLRAVKKPHAPTMGQPITPPRTPKLSSNYLMGTPPPLPPVKK
ncbi:MAG: hypothetical protein ABIY70_05580 [Capsulimonas sp.]|uniref:hypothetical protein n=1 Tax=Capsulimonas sp. TaxID=2494211 RepID=UPI003266777C